MCEFGGLSFFPLSSKWSHCWWSSWERIHCNQWLFFVKYKTFLGGILSRRHHLKSYRTFSDHFGRTLTYNGPVGSEGPGAQPAWLQELLSPPCSLTLDGVARPLPSQLQLITHELGSGSPERGSSVARRSPPRWPCALCQHLQPHSFPLTPPAPLPRNKFTVSLLYWPLLLFIVCSTSAHRMLVMI